jgi:hypothetical protein
MLENDPALLFRATPRQAAHAEKGHQHDKLNKCALALPDLKSNDIWLPCTVLSQEF